MIGILIAILLAALVYWVCLVARPARDRRHRRRDPRPRRRRGDRRVRDAAWQAPLAPPQTTARPAATRAGRTSLRQAWCARSRTSARTR